MNRTYPCYDCGAEMEPRYLWVCEDDRLRCGWCLNRLMERETETTMSAVHEDVEGRMGEGR